MASPVGHTLAGIAAGLMVQRPQPSARKRWLGVVVVAANLADMDFLLGLWGGDLNLFHRQWTHSLVFAAAVTGLVYGVALWKNKASARATALLWGTVMLSHLLVDLLTLDRRVPLGIPLFWPFVGHYVISPFTPLGDLYKSGGMGHFIGSLFCVHNAQTVLREVVLLGPFVILAAQWTRIKEWAGHA